MRFPLERKQTSLSFKPSSRTSSIRVRRVSLSESSSMVGLQLRSFCDEQSVSGLWPDSLSLWPARSVFEPSWPSPLPPPPPLLLLTTRRRCTSPSPRFIVRCRYYDEPPPLRSASACQIRHRVTNALQRDTPFANNRSTATAITARQQEQHLSYGKHCVVDVYPKTTCLFPRWPSFVSTFRRYFVRLTRSPAVDDLMRHDVRYNKRHNATYESICE